MVVETDLLRKGLAPSRPLVVSRYDLVADDGKRMYRVQVKTARWDVRGAAPTLKASWDEPYDADVDVIALVELDAEVVYYVKTTDLPTGTSSVTLRFEPTSRETSSFDANDCLSWPFGKHENEEV